MTDPAVVAVVTQWAAGWFLLARIPFLGRPSDSSGRVTVRGGGTAPGSAAETDGPAAVAPTGSGRLAGSGSDRVAVVVPARNEGGSIGHLLASLAEQWPERVVVVDDDSDDDTAAVARAGGAEVVTGTGPALGWSGKAAACSAGAEVALGAGAEILVFVDADVTFAPGALVAVVDLLRRRGGLVSVQPWHRTGRLVEELSLMPNVVGFMGVGVATPLGDRLAPTAAFGPVLACTAADYRATGGHAHDSVRGSVVDDIALARLFRSHDRPVTVRAGGGLARFRMYPRGLGQMVEGWTKNLAAGAGSVRPWIGLLTAWWITGVLGSPLLAARLGPVGILAVVAFAAQTWWLARGLGRFRLMPWLAPVAAAFFVFLCARSLVHSRLRRRVRWRGRDLPV